MGKEIIKHIILENDGFIREVRVKKREVELVLPIENIVSTFSDRESKKKPANRRYSSKLEC